MERSLMKHLSFSRGRSSLTGGILIPKFYDPDLDSAEKMAEGAGFELVTLGDILEKGSLGSRLGNWVRREHYGTGNIPYVRTSDLSHWRIRPDYKKGVSTVLYDSLKDKQDVRTNDILFVAHGTYLVGTVAMVTEEDKALVLQDHVFRLRVSRSSGVDPNLLLAALSTSFVRRQVRSRQFSADIIDKIGERHLGLSIPIPAEVVVRKNIVQRVKGILSEHSILRQGMASVSQSTLRMTPERAGTNHGFSIARKELAQGILIPKYYDPDLNGDLVEEEEKWDESWVSLKQLVDREHLLATTGQEVGKMAYGTGDVPFLRTSDISEWGVKHSIKHCVGQETYARYEAKAAVSRNDVLLVRDGTYLVGSTALITKHDCPALFCGGMYRLRMIDVPQHASYALLAYLNLPIVRRQMRARQFTRDVIDTLGHRLLEVRIPNPMSPFGKKMGVKVGKIISRKAAIREEVSGIVDMLEPPSPMEAKGRPGWSMR